MELALHILELGGFGHFSIQSPLREREREKKTIPSTMLPQATAFAERPNKKEPEKNEIVTESFRGLLPLDEINFCLMMMYHFITLCHSVVQWLHHNRLFLNCHIEFSCCIACNSEYNCVSLRIARETFGKLKNEHLEVLRSSSILHIFLLYRIRGFFNVAAAC